ncbi:MAG: hypothetical protein Kow0068_19070 [Marinilabiliales bacterium]
MKHIVFYLLLLFGLLLNAQQRPHDAYYYEDEGYYTNPQYSDHGIVVSDNFYNSLYLIKNGNITKLLSAPGCGRYYTISPDKTMIGFKLIENGMQIPAIYNLLINKIIRLHEPVPLCGQVYFNNLGQIVFSIGNEIIVLNNTQKSIYNIDCYANITHVSNDGNFIAYNKNDKIYLLNTNTKKTKLISPEGKMSAYPQFSADNRFLMYQSGGNIFIYDIQNNETKNIGEGLGPKWSPDSKNIIFYKTRVQNFDLIKSELFLFNIDNNKLIQLTSSVDNHEMQPAFIDNNSILFHNYFNKTIYLAKIENNKLSDIVSVFHTDNAPDIEFLKPSSNTKTDILIPGNVPYTHQVYDTPDWHYGYGSCAPTTAIMAIAYYNIVPKWPITCSSPYTHTSYYGSYVADKYTIDTYYYDVVDQTSGGEDAWGGYGYMWGLGSPNSKMADYINGHYLNSTQLWTSSCTFSIVTSEIDAGYPYPMCCMLTSSGHLVLAKGYVSGQHTLIFNDPYGDKNTPGYPSYDGQYAYYDWPGYNNGYQNLDYNGSYGYIAWMVTAEGTETTYNDTIIDDIYYHHGFEINNSANGSHMKYFHDNNAGYNNHLWYTYTMASHSDICWVTWQPDLAQSGDYEVSVFIPSVDATATGAIYHIYYAGGDTSVVVDQSIYSDEWVSLGIFPFDTNQTAMVYLGDSTGIDDQKIAFDAVKWEYRSQPQASFSVIQSTVCTNQPVEFSNTSLNSTSYLWIFEGAGTSTDSNPVITYNNAGVYDVTLIAYGSYSADTLIINDYITVYDSPVSDFYANDTTLLLPNAVATFVNNSSNADSYFWDFGNGSNSTDFQPYCVYTTAGDYDITLISSNQNCPADTLTLNNYIHVLLNSDIADLNIFNTSVYPNPTNRFITVSSDLIESIELIDIQGCIIKENMPENYDCSKLENGIYIIKITHIDKQIEYLKFIKY